MKMRSVLLLERMDKVCIEGVIGTVENKYVTRKLLGVVSV